MKIKYVFFDCWDTILQYTRPSNDCDAIIIYNEIKNKEKMSFKDFAKAYDELMTEYYKTTKFEVEFSHLIRYLLEDNGLISDLTYDEIAEKVALDWHPTAVEGVKDFLKFLDSKGIKYSIVSNTIQTQFQTERYVRNIFKDDYNFERVFASSDYGVKKPNVRFYKLACHILNLDPKDCMFVGDRYYADCVGPSKCGMHPVLLNWQNKTINKEYDVVDHLEVHSYKELLDYCKKEFE